MEQDTIAAISTAASPSGIGIVRISGPEALEVADRVYQSPGGRKKLSGQPSHTIHYGYVVDGETVVDEVLVSVMRAPRTFTAEDTVEINCHGGVYAMGRVLETVLKNGARPAGAGEFTKRAFLNGRLDLSRAEAVIDIIQAKNEYALKSSVSQLKGAVRKRIEVLRGEIIYETAYVESALDDPEHISLEGFSLELEDKVRGWIRQLQKLIDSADSGKLITEGIRTVILGKPNAGKSSLLNLLLGQERAIVTDIAGTTRDTLEETVNISGLTLRLIDTAGIRNTGDLVEQMGVERAKETAQTADLVIYVVDASVPLDENDRQIMELIREKKTLVLLNKSDLETVVEKEEIQSVLGEKGAAAILMISAREQTEAGELESTIRELFFQGGLSFNDEVYITNARQKAELSEALESLRQVENSLELGMPEDFYTIDLMNAYEALGRITGEAIEEDLVNEIFGRFCMGK